MIISRRQEELLSYLTGLAPVGVPASCTTKQFAADLGIKHHRSYHDDFRRLVDVRAIEIVEKGKPHTAATFRVLKRPEAFEVRV